MLAPGPWALVNLLSRLHNEGLLSPIFAGSMQLTPLFPRLMESLADSYFAPAIFLGLASLFVLYIRSLAQWRTRTRGLPFPPGPKPLPLVGNLFDLPKKHAWAAYRDLCAQYGELYLFHTSGIRQLTCCAPRGHLAPASLR